MNEDKNQFVKLVKNGIVIVEKQDSPVPMWAKVELLKEVKYIERFQRLNSQDKF